MSEQWGWVAAVVAIPVIFFGAIEMVLIMRRRRYEAIAKRYKGPRHRPGRGD